MCVFLAVLDIVLRVVEEQKAILAPVIFQHPVVTIAEVRSASAEEWLLGPDDGERIDGGCEAKPLDDRVGFFTGRQIGGSSPPSTPSSSSSSSSSFSISSRSLSSSVESPSSSPLLR